MERWLHYSNYGTPSYRQPMPTAAFWPLLFHELEEEEDEEGPILVNWGVIELHYMGAEIQLLNAEGS